MDLNEMLVFARVVQAGSFTTAGAELGMPKSTVSRKVSDLEARLKARLLQRSSRKLSLTDIGHTYYEYCARIVDEIENAERAVSSLQDTPRGLLRMTAGTGTTFLGPLVRDFLKRYPEVRLELSFTGRVVDLIEERFDLAIRAGTLTDSTLVARSLGAVNWLLVATPAYLRKRGRPRSPKELTAHDCMLFAAGPNGASVRLAKGNQTVQVPLSARLLAADADVLYAAATADLGIALLPAFLCVEDLRARRLERVLGDWEAPSTPIHVVYPTARHLSPKVKTFVEHLLQHTTLLPWELGRLA
jgi:DNA-binding transcriptional LysR family regulator